MPRFLVCPSFLFEEVSMRCSEVMKSQVQTISAGDSIQSAAAKMAVANVGFLPVCDEAARVVGTVTDRDITVRAVARGRSPSECPVAEIMSRDVVTCRPDDDLETAERFMAGYQKSRMVVTDVGGKVAGVISLSDIARREVASKTARILRGVVAREAPRR